MYDCRPGYNFTSHGSTEDILATARVADVQGHGSTEEIPATGNRSLLLLTLFSVTYCILSNSLVDSIIPVNLCKIHSFTFSISHTQRFSKFPLVTLTCRFPISPFTHRFPKFPLTHSLRETCMLTHSSHLSFSPHSLATCNTLSPHSLVNYDTFSLLTYISFGEGTCRYDYFISSTLIPLTLQVI